MKQLINFDPLFTPGAANVGTLDFTQYPGFQGDLLYGVINVTRNQIIYAPGTTTYGGTWSGSIVTLAFNTATYSTNDELNVYYETQPTGGNINTTFNNTALERGGMNEAQYILLSQILMELKLLNLMIMDEFRINRQDFEALRGDMTNPATNPNSTGLG